MPYAFSWAERESGLAYDFYSFTAPVIPDT